MTDPTDRNRSPLARERIANRIDVEALRAKWLHREKTLNTLYAIGPVYVESVRNAVDEAEAQQDEIEWELGRDYWESDSES